MAERRAMRELGECRTKKDFGSQRGVGASLMNADTFGRDALASAVAPETRPAGAGARGREMMPSEQNRKAQTARRS
jgi:hypothetical protein